MRLLAERLRGSGYRILESVEPGGTPIGQQIRRILLDPANQELCPTTELLLMFAARAQNVEQWILPALVEGKIVLSDRFTDSTIAYQGAGRNLDIDAEAGLARAHHRNRTRAGDSQSRIDEQAVEFHRWRRGSPRGSG